MKEWIDIVGEDGCPTGEVVDRDYAHRNGVWHRTAHLWLARKHNGTVQVLLQKRSQEKDSHPGCYDISSAGHIPAGVDYKPSAIRELKEELGVEAEEKDLIYCGDRTIIWDDCFHGKAFLDRQFSRVFLLWMDLPEEKFTVQREEVESVRWMDFDFCCKKVEENSFPHCIAMEELQLLRKIFEEK